jgi:hypothetical protein
MKYSILNAIIYDILFGFCDKKPHLRNNAFVKMAMKYCLSDWVLWRTEDIMKDVDRQIEEIQEEWAEEDPNLEYIEHEPNGSKAQKSLGGAMEIKSPWSDG